MIHIQKIKIVGNSYPSNILKKGFEFNCSSVNLLVGNQGTGKSTLLKLLQQNHKDIQLELSENTLKNGISSYYFDTEKDNPRINDLQRYSNASGQSVGIGIGNALSSHFMSHGEVLESMVVAPLLDAKDAVILLDEPESGLSITNQFRLIEAVKIAVSNNCQLFIATHCFPLIKQFRVISLEHYKEMAGSKFIELVEKDLSL